MNLADLKRIIRLLGPVGTTAGLMASDLELNDLLSLAKKSKIALKSNVNRDDVIKSLIEKNAQPSLRSTDDLLKMSFEQLMDYFNDSNPSSSDLMRIMSELNYKVSAEDKKHLKRYVARQISETALFSNVADPNR